jgi:carbamoyl-phosphate synthase large subunit
VQTEPLNVLVLGVGGNVSQGILKALALGSLRCRVVGACITPAALGLYTTDRSYVSPRAQSPEFLPWLLDVCRKEGIHAVLSGVETVLDVMVRHQADIRAQTGAICVVDTPESIAIGTDKLRTCEWLRDHGFGYPMFAASEDAASMSALLAAKGFPLIAKPRMGKGSNGIHLLHDQAALDRIKLLPGYVVQEVLGDEQTEYTASCFSDRDDFVRGVIVLHRQLEHGTTVCASAGLHPVVREEAQRIAAALRPRGPCNIQMRLHHDRPVCFEINVRFSGTTPIRARLGFNDVEAALRHYVLGEPAVDLAVVTSGQVLRYWNELYVAPEALSELAKNSHLSHPGAFPLQMEDYGKRL